MGIRHRIGFCLVSICMLPALAISADPASVVDVHTSFQGERFGYVSSCGQYFFDENGLFVEAIVKGLDRANEASLLVHERLDFRGQIGSLILIDAEGNEEKLCDVVVSGNECVATYKDWTDSVSIDAQQQALIGQDSVDGEFHIVYSEKGVLFSSRYYEFAYRFEGRRLISMDAKRTPIPIRIGFKSRRNGYEVVEHTDMGIITYNVEGVARKRDFLTCAINFLVLRQFDPFLFPFVDR